MTASTFKAPRPASAALDDPAVQLQKRLKQATEEPSEGNKISACYTSLS